MHKKKPAHLMLFLKRTIWENRANRFLFLFLSLTLVFYYFNLAFIGITAPGRYYIKLVDEHLNYIRDLRSLLVETSAAGLRFFGFKVHTTPFILHIYGYGGVILVYSCLGYALMSMFTASVVARPGKKTLDKICFIFAGNIVIQALNITHLIGNVVTCQKLK